MFRYVALSLALITLGGCTSTSLTTVTQKGNTLGSGIRPTFDCKPLNRCLVIVVTAVAPLGGSGPGAKDCTAVTFSENGRPFDLLEIAKGERVKLTLKLEEKTKSFAFFGSDPVSLYNANKTGPLNEKVAKKFDVAVLADGSSVEIEVHPRTSREEYHFGVALGTRGGGCAGDPRIVNGT
jgi:hypothetical protein